MKRLLLALVVLAGLPGPAGAHHVLGRPSYSLSEDSNTPPAMQVETQIGDYYVTYMVFPAFPEPEVPGRVNLYATRIDDGTPFDGEVTFSVRDEGWFSANEELLGQQRIDDAVYRQGFLFREAGSYVIRAEFFDGEPYIVDFPLRIGGQSGIQPLTIAVLVIVGALVLTTLVHRKRLTTDRIRAARGRTG